MVMRSATASKLIMAETMEMEAARRAIGITTATAKAMEMAMAMAMAIVMAMAIRRRSQSPIGTLTLEVTWTVEGLYH